MNELDVIFMANDLEAAKERIEDLKQELMNLTQVSIIAYNKLCDQHELERFKLKLKFKVLIHSLKQKDLEIERLNSAIDRYYCKMEKVW